MREDKIWFQKIVLLKNPFLKHQFLWTRERSSPIGIALTPIRINECDRELEFCSDQASSDRYIRPVTFCTKKIWNVYTFTIFDIIKVFSNRRNIVWYHLFCKSKVSDIDLRTILTMRDSNRLPFGFACWSCGELVRRSTCPWKVFFGIDWLKVFLVLNNDWNFFNLSSLIKFDIF